MNCQRTRDLLPLFVDGDPDSDLDAEDVEAISEHLKECAECQWRLSLDRQLASKLSSLPEPSLPPDSVDTLRSRVVAQIARDRRWPSLRRATDTSANFLAAVIGLGMISFAILVLIVAGAPFVDRGSGQIARLSATPRTARITPLRADSSRPRPTVHRILSSTPILTSGTEIEPAALHITQTQSATIPARAPPGTHPESVFFVDAAHGWVLDGDCSWPGLLDCTVLTTADGGSTWNEQFHTTLAIPDIFFVDVNHGWLLESDCPGATGWCPTAIFFTTNGGKTWAQRSATDYDLSHLQFVNPNDGWALGRRCPHSPDDCVSTILKTTDGGWKWIDATPKDFTPMDVSFADPVHGWAFGCSVRDRLPGGDCLNPLVLATSDGGKSWTAQLHLSTGFRQYGGRLDFVNRDEGWLLLSVTNQSNCAAENCWGTLYHTTDTGITWSAVQDWAHWDIRDLRQLDTRRSVSGTPSDIRFVTSKFGWMTFNEEPEEEPGGSHSGIAVTSDGGKTWYRANVPGTWRIGDLAATAASPTRAWIVGSQPEVGGSTRFLLEMDQMGRSWAQRLSLNPTTAVDFVDPDLGWGIGTQSSDGATLQTRDGGKTWSRIGGVPDASTVSFVDSQYGWIAVHGGLSSQTDRTTTLPLSVLYPVLPGGFASTITSHDVYATNDGGRSWRTIYHSDDPILWLKFFNRSDGMLVTGGRNFVSNLNLLVSHDGGKSWSWRAVLPPESELLALDFADESTGWMVDRQSTSTTARGSVDVRQGTAVLRVTHDGGSHWLPIGSLSAIPIGSVSNSLVSTQSGWVGYGHTILRTDDAGVTWTRIDLPGTISVGGLRAVDSRVAWLITTDGRLLETEDGGVTWNYPR